MVRGSCLCAGVRFEAKKVPLIVLCHCSLCRKASGSAFEAGAIVATSDFSLSSGHDLIQSYESSSGTQRCFCRVCGSRVPSRSADGKLYFVPAGLLDDDPAVKPALHQFVASKAPWWEITDPLPRFEKWVPGYAPKDQDPGDAR